MLVLTLSRENKVCIADTTEVTLMGVEGHQVSLKFSGPRSVKILREKLVGIRNDNCDRSSEKSSLTLTLKLG